MNNKSKIITVICTVVSLVLMTYLQSCSTYKETSYLNKKTGIYHVK